MYPCVLREVTRVGERLVALGTFVRLGLSHVNLSVQLEVCFGAENLKKMEKKNCFSNGFKTEFNGF